MTKPTPESGNSIDRLLQDRAQFVSWLTRLNSTGEAAPAVPEAVRSRVRADYERRLDAVLAELRGHTAAIEEQVQDLSTRAAMLTTRENEHKEQLSEAEVRHLVGEYDDGKWDGIRAELMKVINQIRSELNQTTGEIDRLNEVLATIRAPVLAPTPEPAPEPIRLADLDPPVASAPPAPVIVSAPRPAVTPPPPPPPKVEPVVHHPEPEPAPPAVEPMRPAAAAATPVGTTEIPFRQAPPKPAPKPAPAAKKDDQPGRTLWFPSGKPSEQGGGGKGLDELAFLKSVTGEPPQAAPHAPTPVPTPRRPSGGFTKPPEAPPAPAPEPPKAAAPAADGKDRSSGSGQKTLKCGECGTLNRPTEWYCERCGAELAAL